MGKVKLITSPYLEYQLTLFDLLPTLISFYPSIINQLKHKDSAWQTIFNFKSVPFDITLKLFNIFIYSGLLLSLIYRLLLIQFIQVLNELKISF